MSLMLSLLIMLVGCTSPMVSVRPPESAAKQRQDRAECAAVGARAAQDYARSPLADLAAVRADREAECLESRGYAATTRVSVRPPPEVGQPGQAQPDPVRRCFQQAYAWLGWYDGPIDGRPNVIWTAAQEAYPTEQQTAGDSANAEQTPSPSSSGAVEEHYQMTYLAGRYVGDPFRFCRGDQPGHIPPTTHQPGSRPPTIRVDPFRVYPACHREGTC